MRNIFGLPVFVPQMTWAGLLPSEVAVKVAEWQLVSVASEVRGPGITNSWKSSRSWQMLSSALQTERRQGEETPPLLVK